MSATQQQPITLSPDAAHQCPDWKRQLAERLDAYRSKHPDASPQQAITTHPLADSRASRIARSVASRYASAPTYSDLMLAATEAENAAAEAQAALAEHDARVAENARIAQEEIFEEEIAQAGIAGTQQESEFAGWSSRETPGPMQPVQTQPAIPVMPQFASRSREMHLHQASPEPEPSLEDLWASSLVEPRASLPSKLIEFPRELVSTHRARPRLPEPPQIATASLPVPSEPSQLRIFEVQPEENPGPQSQSSLSTQETEIHPPASEAIFQTEPNNEMQTAPQDAPQPVKLSAVIAENLPPAAFRRSEADAVPTNAAPTTVPMYRRSETVTRSFKSLEWAAISLDKEPATRSRKLETSVADYMPFLVDPASIDRRLMAFAVDFAAVTAGFLGFLAVFAACTPHLPTGLTAVALAGAVYASLWLLYQTLFFFLSGATAGMLYARIALCTFDDQNPTRPALRHRLAAWWLSCLPLGIGFLWCFVDEDNLGWHDRMTRTYQREY